MVLVTGHFRVDVVHIECDASDGVGGRNRNSLSHATKDIERSRAERMKLCNSLVLN